MSLAETRTLFLHIKICGPDHVCSSVIYVHKATIINSRRIPVIISLWQGAPVALITLSIKIYYNHFIFAQQRLKGVLFLLLYPGIRLFLFWFLLLINQSNDFELYVNFTGVNNQIPKRHGNGDSIVQGGDWESHIILLSPDLWRQYSDAMQASRSCLSILIMRLAVNYRVAKIRPTGARYNIYVHMWIRLPAEKHHVGYGDTLKYKMKQYMVVREI